jgi:hypothetical protein
MQNGVKTHGISGKVSLIGGTQMKKLITIVLALTLVLTLAACSGNGGSNDSTTPSASHTPDGNNSSTPNSGGDNQTAAPPVILEENPASDFEYVNNADLDGVEITRYIGTAERVRIPTAIEGHPVVSIGDYALQYSLFVELQIPDSVTNIGDFAISQCRELSSIIIPDNVTNIGVGAFSLCTGLTNVTIGKSVTKIGNSAFDSCTGLTSVVIPDSVTMIGSSVFQDCTGLTNVTIGNGLTSISESAFRGCTGLTSIVIPDSVTSIGYNAFCDTGLISAVMPDIADNNCSVLRGLHYAVANIPDNGTPPNVPAPFETHRGDKGWFYVVSDDYIVGFLDGMGTYEDSYMVLSFVDGICVKALRKFVYADNNAAVIRTGPGSLAIAVDNVLYEGDTEQIYYIGMTRTEIVQRFRNPNFYGSWQFYDSMGQ